MATTSTSSIHFTVNSSETKRPIFFTSPIKLIPPKRFTISCRSTKSPPKSPPDLSQPNNKNKTPSLSDQLKPLTTTTLSTPPPKDQPQVLSKPKSIWVNPAKPKRSVLSLQRQKRSLYSYNPQVRDLRLFAQKLNDCDSSQEAFLAALEEIPHPPTRENALLILNSLKPWQKTHMFFNWVKSQNLFPMETIFYNVTMKSMRFGRQFQLIEELAEEMIGNGVALDNITYSTIITCAKRSKLFDKAVEWFERMYKTGLMPDEVTYSAILDVYAKLGKVEEVLSLYERGRASGWTPDPIAFSVLGKMFGEAGDYDGIRYVLQEMASIGVKPNLVVYNTLLEAMGKAGKPGLARSLFEEMVASGLKPNEKTLTALVKIYGKARWARDALELWERMRSNQWPMDFILYNTLLNMCADLGLEDEAKRLFEDMKQSEHCRPDSYSYTAMLNIFGSGGNADEAMELFEEMSKKGVHLNVMGCTCLIQCLGRAKRFGDMVRVFNVAVERGVKPDDRLCGCLLSVVSLCEKTEDEDMVFSCLQQANPKLVTLVKVLQDEKVGFEAIKDEFRDVIGSTAVESRRPFCNCLIDICRNKNNHERAHELLYLGTLYGLYPGLHNKTANEWCLDVRSLSIGAAHTALEEWMGTLYKIVQREEALPKLFSAQTGAGTHKFSQGLAHSFGSHVKKLAAPFRQSEEKAGCFVATREDLVSWVRSQAQSITA
ncbi:putative Smr domain, tetratricopeptide-like helical domain, pentacotripeptide-repeat region of PROPR [Rosa chinensis]|uniref:Putative Smr domain, tetratricopeptide-like helical domain, pentacotripeptide-repeat region of PROPR n=1 Tax=Rosa chinensis TaxID=74649 RepID=A0A2P6P9W2_ROSCH|nr:pentatricopeptide repeat-containing protein At5g46580, chloroplastic [Rosa chinensis]PRQ18715.1 putative Smr domain, tetratricopeptide-like helical domain, pentacotripeptide-repeat region of PROPR [Rosa chinensis]